MTPANELLTPSEAAVVANVTVRNINRAIDEAILPKRFFRVKDGGRWVKSDACAFVYFYFHTAARLTAEERTRVIHSFAGAAKRPKAGSWVFRDDFMTLNFDRFVEETAARHATLRRARERVVEDPDILGGAPTLKGTRISVYDIAAAVAAGATEARLQAAYPMLDDDDIELATLYAEANPARGRPKRPAALPVGAEVFSERAVARRRRG
jgi:uncharacterized protein (DUF433 family)